MRATMALEVEDSIGMTDKKQAVAEEIIEEDDDFEEFETEDILTCPPAPACACYPVTLLWCGVACSAAACLP